MRREHANRESIGTPSAAGAGAPSDRTRRPAATVLAAGLLVTGAAACNYTSAAGKASDSGHQSPAKSAAKATTGSTDTVKSDGEPGVPMCTADDLKVHLGEKSPGAGNIYVPLVFTNTSSRTCELKGYPGVSLLDGSREMIGKPAHEVTATRAYVNLAPGKSGRATLHTLNKGVSGKACWQPAADLRTYPPGSKAFIVVPAHGFQICGGTFAVSTMKPGTGA